ncbi:MAG: TolC family protein [Desulfuromonadaceae bacterium]|nr:TolC family protein [Desulfuromonadaceae bacterium]MDD2856266.1 TolC family protein [Desulfuromonadaceae bacterium]
MHRLLILCTLILLPAASAEASSLKLTVKDALRMALDNNSNVKAARYNSEATAEGAEIATSRYLPTISFEESLMASNSPTNVFIMKLDEGRFNPADFATPDVVNHPATKHDFKTALSIQQPIFVPSLAPLKQLAIKDVEKSALQLEATRQKVAFQAFQTYLELQRAAAQLKASEKAVVDARENMRLASVRTSSGVGLKSDELRSRTHLSMVEQQQLSTRNDLTLAQMKLAILIGLKDESVIEVSDLPEAVQVPPMTDQSISEALQNRVEIRQSHIDMEKSDEFSRMTKRAYLPTIGAFASYQLNGEEIPFSADTNSWSAGVSLKWDIFDGFRRGSERKKALSSQSAAREVLASAGNDVKYQLKESYIRRDEAGKRLEMANHSLKDAEETVRLLGRRYENSLATMVELLDAQTTLNQVRANLVDAEAGYALAGGQVYFMSGTFVKEMLK